jgi:hypothetical protein
LEIRKFKEAYYEQMHELILLTSRKGGDKGKQNIFKNLKNAMHC